MAAGIVQLAADGSGAKMQTVVNTVNAVANTNASCVHLVTSAGASTDPASGNGVSVLGNVDSGSGDSGSPVKVGGVYATSLPTLTNGNRSNFYVDVNGRQLVVTTGNVASGATDSGNPVKVGGVYSSSLPTLTDGQRGHIQLDASGRQLVVSAGNVAAAATDSGNPVKVGGVFLRGDALPAYATTQRGDLQIDQAGTLKVGNFPLGTPVTDSHTGAATAVTCTLAASANKFTYLEGFTVTGLGATSAGSIQVTTTGLSTNLTYTLPIPAGATVGVTPLDIRLPRPVPASAVNTAITVVVGSFGSGNTVASASAYGFQL